jgi:hypothetical protein
MKSDDIQHYLSPSRETTDSFLTNCPEGPVVFLSLVRFRKFADYSDHPELKPDAPITGEDAYDNFIRHAVKCLARRGGELFFLAKARHFLVGPPHERWDRVLLVRHASVRAFAEFAEDSEFVAGLGHRSAAIEDSRVLPLTQMPRPY